MAAWLNLVYQDWEKIVSNLTDSRMTRCDARTFSIHKFYLARNISWCLDVNEIERNPGILDEEGTVYSENKYRNILQYISNSGILDDIDFDEQMTSMLGRRLQRDVNKISKLSRADRL